MTFWHSLFSILVCGGDGTVGWIMDEMYKIYGSLHDRCVEETLKCDFLHAHYLKLHAIDVYIIACRHVPIALIPLGTGNDLARVLGWGTGFDGDLRKVLNHVQNAHTSVLDR
jgi:diacylglycerol kinase (ATP)